MQASYQRLYVNIDHVATLRQARGGGEPDPTSAAVLCILAGVDGITAHLREDRRHIQDTDIERIRSQIDSYFNLECACTEEMIGIALRVKPNQVTLVPERREEVTTEGGLDVERHHAQIGEALGRLKGQGIRTSLFIDPDLRAVEWSHRVGADAIELHTGQYSLHVNDPTPIGALRQASQSAAALGLAVHAGHGLTVRNVAVVSAIPEVEELNIGHSIVSRAIFVGLEAAVREIREAMDAARRA